MEFDTLLDMEKLREIYIISNVPAYLFDRLKRENSIVRLSRSITGTQVTKALNKLLIIENKTIDDFVIFYSLLTVLLLLPYSMEALRLLESFDSTKVKWLDYFKYSYRESPLITQISKIDLANEYITINLGNILDKSNNTKVIRACKPTIKEIS